MKKPIAFAAFMLMAFSAFCQDYGIYMTADDYINNTPIKCVLLTETKGKGPSDIIAKFADGTTKKYVAGTFWGILKPSKKEFKISTAFRYFKEKFYPIVTTGALWFYDIGISGWKLQDNGDTVFWSGPEVFFISTGPNDPPKKIRYNYAHLDVVMDSIYAMMDSALVPQVKELNTKMKEEPIAPIYLYSGSGRTAIVRYNAAPCQFVQYYNYLKAGTP